MKKKWSIYSILFLIALLTDCNSHIKNEDTKSGFIKSINDVSKMSLYCSVNKETLLILYKQQKTYYFEKTISGILFTDTGSYTLNTDTLILKSIQKRKSGFITVVKDSSDFRNENKDSIDLSIKLFDKILKISDGLICIDNKNKLELSNNLIRVGTEERKNSFLINGNGFLITFNNDFKSCLEYGYYKNGELYQGHSVLKKSMSNYQVNNPILMEIDYNMIGCFGGSKEKLIATISENKIKVQLIFNDSVYRINYFDSDCRNKLDIFFKKISSIKKGCFCTTAKHYKIFYNNKTYEFTDDCCEYDIYNELKKELFKKDFFTE